jgi:hypothetical protein
MRTKRVRRTTEITIDTEEYIMARASQKPTHGWCARCRKAVPLARPEEAAAKARVTVRTICRWADGGILHFREAPDGFLLICCDSLRRCLEASHRATGAAEGCGKRAP